MLQKGIVTRCLAVSLILALACAVLLADPVAQANSGAGLAPHDVGATATALIKVQQSIYATKTAMAATAAAQQSTSTPLGQATATPKPTATATRLPPTATATPRPAPPFVEILLDGVNLRAGPGPAFPVLGALTRGQRYPVASQAAGCGWLQVMLEDGSLAWLSGAPLYSQLSVPCASLPATTMASPSATAPAATPTAAATALAKALPSPTATALPVKPTAKPTATNAPTAAPPTQAKAQPTAPPPTAVPTATPAPASANDAGGPTAISPVSPEAGATVSGGVRFAWSANAELAPGQVFELVFWQPGESAAAGRAWTGAAPASSQTINADNQPPGDYFWGIYLARLEPSYTRLRFLGEGGRFKIGGGGGGSSGNSDPDYTGGK